MAQAASDGKRQVDRAADDEAEHLRLRTGIGKACIRRRVTRVELAKRGDRTDRLDSQQLVPQQRHMQLGAVIVWLIGFAKSDP